MRRYECIARVLALHYRGEHKTVRQQHRHILQRMHGEVGAAVGQRGLQLFHEQPFAADLGQGTIKNLVAARRHAEDVDLACRVQALQRGTHMFRLP